MKIKLIISAIILLLITGLGLSCWMQHNKINSLKTELNYATVNLKAFETENDTLKCRNLQFQYTIDQLNCSNDSLFKKLNSARKELKIKDKALERMSYLECELAKKDSIIIRDTIFRENVKLDTLIKDEWSWLGLHFEYPGNINANYGFKNETMIFMSTERRTIEEPKKCFIARWFQKKHTVVTVDVVQQNPYCENKTERHVEIVK